MKFFLLCAFFSTGLFAKEYEVKMRSMSYNPKILKIVVGDKVKWSNSTYTKHTATSDTNAFDTGTVKINEVSGPITFEKPGTYVYSCLIHGSSMKGTIVVGAK